MTPKRGPRYSKEEFERRGDALYETKVLPNVKKADHGKFAAIDIETGEYEIARTEIAACDRLEARIPDPQTWLVRIGSRYLYSFGGQRTGGIAADFCGIRQHCSASRNGIAIRK